MLIELSASLNVRLSGHRALAQFLPARIGMKFESGTRQKLHSRDAHQRPLPDLSGYNVLDDNVEVGEIKKKEDMDGDDGTIQENYRIELLGHGNREFVFRCECLCPLLVVSSLTRVPLHLWGQSTPMVTEVILWP